MLGLVVFGAVFAAANAIVCMPDLCEHIKQEPLNCAGSVIKNGGYCGCTDVCAKMEGETCQATFIRGIIPVGRCDTGLACRQQEMMAFGRGLCVKDKTESRWKSELRFSCDAIVEGDACQASVMYGNPVSMGSCDKGLECKAGGDGVNVGLLNVLGRGTCVKTTKTKRSTRTKCEQERLAAEMSMIMYAQKWTARCDADGNFLPMQCDESGHCFCVNSDGVIQGKRILGKISCPAIQ